LLRDKFELAFKISYIAIAKAYYLFLRVDNLREFVAIINSIRGIKESSYNKSNK
jgi:hypothetical protein